MSKRKDQAFDIETLRAQFDTIAERSVANFSAPRVPTKVLVQTLGVPRTSLNNWMTKKVFDLDADRHRKGNEERLWSAADAVKLAAAAQTSAIGLPVATAKALGEHLCDFIVGRMRTIHALAGGSRVVIFRQPGSDAWEMIHHSERRANAFVFKDGAWKTEQLTDQLERVPPMRVEFDVTEFVANIVNALQLDVTMVVGTTDDFRRGRAKGSRE